MNNIIDRKIVLDTETTGMNFTKNFYEGHRIIEIGAVELVNRQLTNNNFHVYLQPDRIIESEAFNVHGISNEFLSKKPRFCDIASNFLNYIKESELIIHNAKFDVGFIDYEFKKLDYDIKSISNFCHIIDTLSIARTLFPGKKNNLDALCSRYKIKNHKRNLHSAIIDAKLLSQVYLIMTTHQKSIMFQKLSKSFKYVKDSSKKFHYSPSKILKKANEKEILSHTNYLELMKNNHGKCIWIKN